jgi:hypothetical protein
MKGKSTTKTPRTPRKSKTKILIFSWCLGVLVVNPLFATPVWKTPKELPLGELSVLELVEDDATKPSIPRPGEEKLGPLALRGVDPTPDGRGWKLTVQPLVPGTALVPAMDLGDGRKSPELRIAVPRTTPYGAPWVGVGGGQGDILPYLPFPWEWASLLLLPLAGIVIFFIWRWRKGASSRALHHARRVFAHHWPPTGKDRKHLDEAHTLGRNLLAAHFGDTARSWSPRQFQEQKLEFWAEWSMGLDALRFAKKDAPFPPANELLKELERKP